jgi:hypothetical protein
VEQKEKTKTKPQRESMKREKKCMLGLKRDTFVNSEQTNRPQEWERVVAAAVCGFFDTVTNDGKRQYWL